LVLLISTSLPGPVPKSSIPVTKSHNTLRTKTG
jgi:hypothetical protein